MCGGVENPLWTPRYTPSQSSSGGAGEERRGEERRGHTCTLGLLIQWAALSWAASAIELYWFLFFLLQRSSTRKPPHPDLAPCQVNHSSTAARCKPEDVGNNFYLYLTLSFFNIILPGLSAAITEPIKCREFANYRVNRQEGCVRGEGGHRGALRRPSWRGGGSAAAAAVGSGEENTVLSLIRRPEGLNHCSSSPPSPNYFLSSSSFIFVPSLKLKTEKFSL